MTFTIIYNDNLAHTYVCSGHHTQGTPKYGNQARGVVPDKSGPS
jgi:hypothetical protein